MQHSANEIRLVDIDQKPLFGKEKTFVIAEIPPNKAGLHFVRRENIRTPCLKSVTKVTKTRETHHSKCNPYALSSKRTEMVHFVFIQTVQCK